MKTTIGVYAMALTLAISLQAQAGDRTGVQGLGMARSSTAYVRGIDAIGINPANLDADSATVTLSLLPFGLHVGSDFLTYGLYTQYFTGVQTDNGRVSKSLTDADKQDILNAFPGGVGTLSFDLEVRPVGLAIHTGWGTLGLTMTEKASAAIVIPNQLAQFVFYGNVPGSVYDLSATSMKAWWLREYAATLATSYDNILGCNTVSFGASVKMVHGFGYAEVTKFNSRLETSTTGVLHGVVNMYNRSAGIDPLTGSTGKAGFNPFPAPAGAGLGLDFGVAADVSKLVRVGMSVTDIGSLLWSRNVRESSADSSFTVDNPLDGVQRDGVEKALQGTSRAGEAFSTPLPTTVRAGVALNLTSIGAIKSFVLGDLAVAADFAQVLYDAPGYSAGTRVSVGMEWSPFGFLPIRTGYSWGGPDHSNFALGFGLHLWAYELDFASENLGFLFDQNTFSYGSVSVGMKFRF
jgi:hypothetical protein